MESTVVAVVVVVLLIQTNHRQWISQRSKHRQITENTHIKTVNCYKYKVYYSWAVCTFYCHIVVSSDT